MNVLRQQFHADKPNQIWVSDVTCFRLGDRYLYTCVILDLFSRKVVACGIALSSGETQAAPAIRYRRSAPSTLC